MPESTPSRLTIIERTLRFCIEKRILIFLIALLVAQWGVLVSPFDWKIGGAHRSPVPVDAIPDIGENQQIVFTRWPGRSPQDVEDQITYPLTVSLLGVPGVRTVRSFSMFGFSTIYVIFKEDVEFYWSRTRILEKLSSLAEETLPEDARPVLGPDATALGQVFWYTLEGRDADGEPVGGWDLHELRTVQDWYVRYSLMAADGVSEVASVGGFVREYQVDIDPDRMRIHGVTLAQVVDAVRSANRDVGAQTIEINNVEYLIRGLGFIKRVRDIEDAVIRLSGTVPVFVKNVANVTLGPAARRGALDKGGAEAVGGVVVMRFGENPLRVIRNVKQKIAEISPGLPRRMLDDGTESRVSIVPFYDRTQLIRETLGTLETALSYEILVTIIVVTLMTAHLRSALLIAGVLPLSVLICFIAMKLFRVDANIVALSGIAIAIGTMVDMGIILLDNIRARLDDAPPDAAVSTVVRTATAEVGGAVMTAIATTVLGFLPVFALIAAEGKLFRPLAFTKTFALVASLLTALFLIPPLATLIFSRYRFQREWIFHESLIYIGGIVGFAFDWPVGLMIAFFGIHHFSARWFKPLRGAWFGDAPVWVAVFCGIILLSRVWQPLGVERHPVVNFLFTALLIGMVLGGFQLFQRHYARILNWCLVNRKKFLCLPALLVFLGLLIWHGYTDLLGWTPRIVRESGLSALLSRAFPGLGEEFMPPLDEGAYLLMPTTMPHAGIGEVMEIMRTQDIAISAIPEVASAVGKLGRAETALDPAPISMIETLINYHSEYLTGPDGKRMRFRFDRSRNDLFRSPDGLPAPGPDGKPYTVSGRFKRDEKGELIPDENGQPFRVWRPALRPELNPGRDFWPGIQTPDDIWDAIIRASAVPGTTTAARLQPISARLVMLQSGIRANMGIKVRGPDLATIQKVTLQMERLVREVPSVEPFTVIADRMVAKPYLEINVDRQAIAQYGIPLRNVLEVIEYAIGGRRIGTSVESRERYPIRVRYIREMRDSLESLGRILVPSAAGPQIPLGQLAEIIYVRGPQVIKGEDSFLTGYVLFDKKQGFAETDVVEAVRDYLEEKREYGELTITPGVSYAFTGTYENHERAEKRLRVILPVALVLIFIILYLQFNSAGTSLMVFSGIAVAWSGGFVMIWLYGQEWFLNFSVFGASMRELFQVGPINLSVAIWVGFLALFGIASDDGVVMASYLDGAFRENRPTTVAAIREATVAASLRRVRPCLMTTATTILALIPVLTSEGRGADIMIPMAIPSFGGMVFEVVTMLVVPVLYCWRAEREAARKGFKTG